MTTKELLICARDRIKDPERWMTGRLASTKTGGVCGYDDPNAARWCAIGALLRCSSERNRRDRVFAQALDRLSDAGPASVTRTNDYFGHAAVMEMYERAIEAAS